MTVVSVGRGGQEIGDYNLEGLKEGLANGFFLPDDWGWYDGLTEWVPLSQLVAKLNPPPLLPPPPPVITALPPIQSLVSPALPPLPKIKQNLKPKKGEVTYVLRETKPKRSAKKTALRPSWRDDPATEKQIAFLGHLKAGPLPSNLTKGQAHDMIDARVSGHDFLSPKQMACLSYHGFDPSSLDYDEAKAHLDQIHESPESFHVPEPWETAKYHLYPNLYPPVEGKKPRGCAGHFVLLFAAALLFVMALGIITRTSSPGLTSDTAVPPAQPAASSAPTLTTSPSPVTPPSPPEPSAPVVAPAASEATQTSPESDSSYRGTASTDFRKNWVKIDGTILSGVSIVTPAPHGQVSIIWDGGGKGFPASSVPQGFLDEWGMTLERLKAADGQ